MTRAENAAMKRKEMLRNLRHVVWLCSCCWPIDTYRNGDGHHPDCLAHKPIADALHQEET